MNQYTTLQPKTCPSATHGMSRTRTYSIWAGIIKRCTNHKSTDYAEYGGSGIQVCDRWRNSFEAFYEDMGPCPSTEHSIDRINNDGNYTTGNCRWATRKEQQLNKRNTIWVEAFGERKTLQEWIYDPRCVVPYATLWGRLKRGMPAEQAMTSLSRPSVPRWAEAFGEFKAVSDWAQDTRCVVSYRTLLFRLTHGTPPEQAIVCPARSCIIRRYLHSLDSHLPSTISAQVPQNGSS